MKARQSQRQESEPPSYIVRTSKDCQQLLEVRKGKKDRFPKSSDKEGVALDLGSLTSRSVKITLAGGSLPWQPQETHGKLLHASLPLCWVFLSLYLCYSGCFHLPHTGLHPNLSSPEMSCPAALVKVTLLSESVSQCLV